MNGSAAMLAGYDEQHPFEADPSQSVNLAGASAETLSDKYSLTSPQGEELSKALTQQLARMQSIWFVQAGMYKGLPLDDRATAVVLGLERPQLREPPFEEGTLYYRHILLHLLSRGDRDPGSGGSQRSDSVLCHYSKS